MPVNTLIGKEASKLTDSEKAIINADKNIVAMAKRGDAASLNRYFARMDEVRKVLNQQEAGEGKRFNGAASHEFADNLKAYADTVTRGMIPTSH